MSPRSFRHPAPSRGDPKFRTGLQRGQAIVREGGERPVIQAYIYVYMSVSKLVTTELLSVG